MTEGDFHQEQRLIDYFNPRLRFVECLRQTEIGGPVSTVFKVRDEEQDAYKIFKESGKYGYPHLVSERNALLLASETGNINHLVDDYIDRGVIVKEYFEGEDICSAERTREFIGVPSFYRRLKELVSELNGLGIAGIDLHETNIFMNPDRTEFRLIELGGVVLRGEEDFQGVMTKDQEKIKRLPYLLRDWWGL